MFKIKTFYSFGQFPYHAILEDGIMIAKLMSKNYKLAKKIKTLLENEYPTVNIVSQDNQNNMNDALNAIRNTKGQFFGLTTKTTTLNAQFRGETPSYVKVWDRNENRLRRFNKKSLVKVNMK